MEFIKRFFRRKDEPKLNTMPPDYTDVIGGYWGNAINWFTYDYDNRHYKVVGWKPFSQRLEVGDTILSEGERCWAWFAITNIDRKSNPSDMFFADVTPIFQLLKSEYPTVPTALPQAEEG